MGNFQSSRCSGENPGFWLAPEVGRTVLRDWALTLWDLVLSPGRFELNCRTPNCCCRKLLGRGNHPPPCPPHKDMFGNENYQKCWKYDSCVRVKERHNRKTEVCLLVCLFCNTLSIVDSLLWLSHSLKPQTPYSYKHIFNSSDSPWVELLLILLLYPSDTLAFRLSPLQLVCANFFNIVLWSKLQDWPPTERALVLKRNARQNLYWWLYSSVNS